MSLRAQWKLPLCCVLLAALIQIAASGWVDVNAQETAPLLKADIIVSATGYLDDRIIPTEFCAYLPEEASMVTISRRSLVPEVGITRPLTMSIMPYASTTRPLVDKANVDGTMTLSIPQLGFETCFTFENRISASEGQAVAQAYKYFAQIVSIEVR